MSNVYMWPRAEVQARESTRERERKKKSLTNEKAKGLKKARRNNDSQLSFSRPIYLLSGAIRPYYYMSRHSDPSPRPQTAGPTRPARGPALLRRCGRARCPRDDRRGRATRPHGGAVVAMPACTSSGGGCNRRLTGGVEEKPPSIDRLIDPSAVSHQQTHTSPNAPATASPPTSPKQLVGPAPLAPPASFGLRLRLSSDMGRRRLTGGLVDGWHRMMKA